MKRLVLALALVAMTADCSQLLADPLPNVKTSWVGNTYGLGLTDDRRSGKWVQSLAEGAAVSPDGKVYTNSGWEEGGRNAGIYAGKIVNGKEIGDVVGNLSSGEYMGEVGKVGKEHSATGSAVAANSTYAYATRGNIHRYKLDGSGGQGFINQGALAIAVNETHLVASQANGEITVYKLDGPTKVSSWRVEKPGAVAITPKGDVFVACNVVKRAGREVWRTAGQSSVKRFDLQGQAKPGDITGAAGFLPSCLAVDNKGRLMVGDSGPRRQVLFYDISAATPKLVDTLGAEGGISAGPQPYRMTPEKFYALAGCGADKQGNLYVIMDELGVTIRKFSPAKKFMWELCGHMFVESADFDPASDGKEVYTPNERYTLDLTKTAPGSEWSFTGYLMDSVKHPEDPRHSPDKAFFGSAIMRRVDGKRLLYCCTMTANSMFVYRFEGESNLSIFSKEVHIGSWAFNPDDKGNIWYAKDNKIFFIPQEGFDAQGNPVYGQAKQIGEKPAELKSIERIEYRPDLDALFLVGDIPQGDWGIIGTKMVRISDWSKGNRKVAYVTELPYGPGVPGKNRLKAICWAGDYVFAVGVETRCMVRVMRASDGKTVGELVPGPEVNGVNSTGWVDIPYGIRAMKRSNGEYLVLIEEDGFAKVLLMRWKP